MASSRLDLPDFDARYKGLRPASSYHAPPAQSWALAQAWAGAPQDLDGHLEGVYAHERTRALGAPQLYSPLVYGLQVYCPDLRRPSGPTRRSHTELFM